MFNYGESDVVGVQWRRWYEVLVAIPVGQRPMIYLGEESAVKLGGKIYTERVQGMEFPFDPAESFPMLDRATGLPTGEVVLFDRLHQEIWSMCMAKATARDVAVAQEAVERPAEASVADASAAISEPPSE